MLTIGSGELASAVLSTSLILNIFEVIFWCLKCAGLFLLSIVSTCLHSWCCASFSLCVTFCLFVNYTFLSNFIVGDLGVLV